MKVLEDETAPEQNQYRRMKVSDVTVADMIALLKQLPSDAIVEVSDTSATFSKSFVILCWTPRVFIGGE